MKRSFSTAALVLSAALMGGSLLSGALVPHVPTEDSGLRTVSFGRSGPCGSCGAAAPMTVTTADGAVWHITRAGSVADVLAEYCPTGGCAYSLG